jgi:DNA polymerase-4
MDRQIVCYQIPAFEIALTRIQDASLRNRPVAIASSHTARAPIHELSSEAMQAGLCSGMPVQDARRLCPSLRVLPADPVRVGVAHQQLLDVIGRFAPVWEPLGPGHLFLDLTGTTRLWGPTVDAAARIEREVIHRYRLPGVMGIGSNKLVSRVAADVVQPPQLCDVRAGSERIFLAPLPVTLLPACSRSSGRILALLEDLNLRTWGEIAEIPLPQLAVAFGGNAVLLHRWVNGIDTSPVLPPVQHPTVEISCTLDPDEVDDSRLLARLYGLLEELCRTLRRQRRICRRLALSLWHSDHVEISRHRTLTLGTYWEVDMYPCLKGLFLACFQRRVRVRRMTLRAEALAPPEEQLSLFDFDTPQTKKHARVRRLALALDDLRQQFGPHTLSWGATRVAPHGTLAERSGVQPSLRGCDGETPRASSG